MKRALDHVHYILCDCFAKRDFKGMASVYSEDCKMYAPNMGVGVGKFGKWHGLLYQRETYIYSK